MSLVPDSIRELLLRLLKASLGDNSKMTFSYYAEHAFCRWACLVDFLQGRAYLIPYHSQLAKEGRSS